MMILDFGTLTCLVCMSHNCPCVLAFPTIYHVLAVPHIMDKYVTSFADSSNNNSDDQQ